MFAVLTEVSRTIHNPNLDDPMDDSAAQQYRQHNQAYEATVSDWVQRYAMLDPLAAAE
jgi:ubiquitin-protein ligase